MSAEMLGLCRPYEFEGQTYQVAPRDIHIEAQFCLWMAAEAALELSRLRLRIPADFYAEQMRLYNAKICGKQFEWGREDVHNASYSDAGQKQLLWLKMKRGEAKGGEAIERETIDAIAKDADKWEELLSIYWQQDHPDFFADLQIEAKQEKAPIPQPSLPPKSPPDAA